MLCCDIRTEIPENPDKNLLSSISGLFRVPEIMACYAVDFALVETDQCLPGQLISFTTACQNGFQIHACETHLNPEKFGHERTKKSGDTPMDADPWARMLSRLRFSLPNTIRVWTQAVPISPIALSNLRLRP